MTFSPNVSKLFEAYGNLVNRKLDPDQRALADRVVANIFNTNLAPQVRASRYVAFLRAAGV